MTYLTLTEPAMWRIGLIPRGPASPTVYGLTPVKRRGNGWLFEVTVPWRWLYVVEGLTQWEDA